MFKNAKVGDKVFDYLRQEWCTVIKINKKSIYFLEVLYKNNDIENFTVAGCITNYDKVPVLFWDEVKPITPPKKPLPKLKVDTTVLVSDSIDTKLIGDSSNMDLGLMGMPDSMGSFARSFIEDVLELDFDEVKTKMTLGELKSRWISYKKEQYQVQPTKI